MEFIISTVLLIIFVILVSYFDLKLKKIYNYLTLPFLCTGIVFNLIAFGYGGLYQSLIGALVGLIILIFPFILGWVGGGDVKMLCAAGAMVGGMIILYSTLVGLILSGIAALAYLIKRRELKSFCKQLLFTLYDIRNFRYFRVSGSIPLGVYLGIGIIICWFYFRLF